MYELKDLTKTYAQGPTTIRAVDGVDLAIAEGEMVVIEGPSGSGKSTLLQLLGGLDRPSSGGLEFEGENLAELGDRRLAALRSRAFGFVFQHFNLVPTLSAAENVEAAMAPAGTRRAVRRARVAELLGEVGLADRSDHLPSQLSGGEQQRVAIARALANEPRVLLADELTGNLDTETGNTVLDLLENLWRAHGLTIVLVTHDPRVSARSSRVLRMRDGRFVGPSTPASTVSSADLGVPPPTWAAPTEAHVTDKAPTRRKAPATKKAAPATKKAAGAKATARAMPTKKTTTAPRKAAGAKTAAAPAKKAAPATRRAARADEAPPTT